MGVYKANRYGDRILRVVSAYAGTPGGSEASELRNKLSDASAPAASYRDSLIAAGKTEAYQSWSEEEDARLTREHYERCSMDEMIKNHKRTRGAILARLRKLNLI